MFFKKNKEILNTSSGFVDGLIDGHISGWLKNENAEPCFFELFVNDILVHEGFANKHREDLCEFGSNGELAFSVPVTDLLKYEELVFSSDLEIYIRSDHKRIANNKQVIHNSLLEYINHVDICGILATDIYTAIKSSGLWDDKFYINRYLQSNFLGDPLLHYILFGWKKGYKASPFFSHSYYNIHYHDVVRTGVMPIYHYIVTGEKEGRKPNDYFCPQKYLAANPDLEKFEGVLLSHYSYSGIQEGRSLDIIKPIPNEIENGNTKLTYKDLGYLTDFELANIGHKKELCPSTLKNTKDKVIAYYLPQFHPFEQNNKWWGKGFTEWTNVTKAKALAVNHHQPRVPTDFGFYDLRLKENISEQIALAKKIGVESFCLYYYWFNGTVLMDTPIELIYNNPELDTEYCICWANENWTRAWDGQDKEVLIEQTYSEEDDIDFISHTSKYFKDPRYTCVVGNPLLIIYRPSIFPDMKATLKRWREWCLDNGVGEIHAVMVQFEDTDPQKYGFDAAVEFPPHQVGSQNVAEFMEFNSDFQGSVHDYNGMVSKGLNKVDEGYIVYKGVTMDWDNTARRQERASFFVNTTPQRTERWLGGISQCYDNDERDQHNRLVFVNAWNEWAEGTYLEPDVHNGYGYANAVASLKSGHAKAPKVAVLAHVFYDDLVDEIIGYIGNIPVDFDILVTCVADSYETTSKKLNEAFPERLVDIVVVPNHGRDIAPFLCNHINSYYRYDYICKIHSKKSLHAGGIDNWRTFLYDRLLGSKEQISDILARFENDKTLGIQYPEYSDAIKPFIDWGSNKVNCQEFMNILGLDCPAELPDFPAGSMFWFRPDALDALFNKSWHLSDFPEECGQIDETIMHAVERCFLIALNTEKNKYVTLGLLS
jgi:lipopolysaccharide biosynthesis protein